MLVVSKAIQFRVRFEPDGAEVMVDAGTLLTLAALEAGIELRTSCGGSGTCGMCGVWVKTGELSTKVSAGLTDREYQHGLRLACQSRVVEDVTVLVSGPPVKDTCHLHEEFTGGRLIPGIASAGWNYRPPVTKYALKLNEPSIKDNQPDLKRLRKALSKKGHDRLNISYSVLKTLPDVLRAGNWKVTATVVDAWPCPMLVNLQSGDVSGKHYEVILDVGTTAIRGQLLDLNTGMVVSEAIDYNRQSEFGEDVISRIVYSRQKGGLTRLQKAVAETIDGIISKMSDKAEIKKEHLSHLTVAGNTVMTQMLFSVDPEPLRLSPYVPAFDTPPQVSAKSIGINLPEHVYIYAMPCVSSYVGGDIVAGVIGTGIYQRERISLYIDIGTNGEIVVGNSEWLVTAACSAGPTFEGGGVKFGMVASKGAIEGFTLEPETQKPSLSVIGGIRPGGICGSGLINIVATLLKAGILGQNGKFNLDADCSQVRQGDDGPEYVIVEACNSLNGNDIVITEMDIDNFIRSKAAIFAGCHTLVESVGLKFGDIDDIIISGTFGNRINIESAVQAGLLPDLPREKFYYVGNGSLLGARLTSFSKELYQEGITLPGKITNFELSEDPSFMDNYIAGLFLPHTDKNKFPSVEYAV